jgi:hypothetical protein
VRPIWLVLKAIKTRVPPDFEKRADFLNQLNEIEDSAAYTAPEAMPMRWKQVAWTLEAFLGEPVELWKQEIAGIFANQIDYKQFLKEEEV